MVHDATNGTAVFDGTTVTFTPAPDYNGPASFRYTVSDGFATDVGQVDITVTPVNDAPDAVDDLASVDEDDSVDVSPLDNDTNDDGPLAITAFTQGANGTVTRTLDTLTYAPAANFAGTDTFTYTAEDLGGLSDTATVTVTVNPVADTPVAMDGTATTDEGQAVTITLTATDPDLPAVSLTFAIASAPTSGTLGPITQATATSATVTYTPTGTYAGPDAFTFTASDGTSTSAPATVSITVTNVITCGDGVREPPETCDDTNLIDGDGCSMTCAVEPGWDCGVAQPSVCDAICGDGITIAGEEECDDMNAIDTDGCTTQCHAGPVCATSVPALAGGDRFATDPATGACYVSFDDEQTTFADAQLACIAAGGHLVSITTSEERALVISVHNLTQEPWIGLTDELVEGSFGWITGEPLTRNDFGPGQPDGGDAEDCVNLTAGTSAWNDTSCTFIGFTDGRICELEVDSCGDGNLHSSRGETCDDGNTATFDGCNASCQLETLFFSEYIEGTSNNKAIEIANPFSIPTNLTGCSLRLYSNGAAAPSATLNLTQTIAPNDVLVVCHTSANATIQAQCDVVTPASGGTAVINFNGDDALELFCAGAPVDVFGQIGFDPGAEWGTGLTSTADNTLRRRCGVTVGDSVGGNVFDPSIEWGGFAVDTFGDLGTYGCFP
jgi:cysteine-rich repeat protein